uniref:Uncharacterized protein n=1 Tax=Arundo donax TaxID=35708 RepID=A0A0A8Z8T1_ARUDO
MPNLVVHNFPVNNHVFLLWQH